MKVAFPRLGVWLTAAVFGVIVVAASAQPTGRTYRPEAGPEQSSTGSPTNDRDRFGPAEASQVCLSGPATCAQIEALSNQVKALQSKLNQMSSQIEPVLQRQNIYCQTPTVSANGLGATDSCLPYRCNQVSGLCHDVCRSVDDCAPPNICDLSYHCSPLN